LKGSVKISCFLAHTLLLVKGRWADKKWGRKLSMIEWSGLLALHLKMILPDLKKIILKVRGLVR